ncbi:MAG: ribosome biogenesis GTP-binding protein YsxC [Pseudomonadales bacterium]|nr:ribosome biogenesis GTP-binding protein YsxC [Pseudomonadales bacterium]
MGKERPTAFRRAQSAGREQRRVTLADSVEDGSNPIVGSFWKGVDHPSLCPNDRVPEIAFAGRSNSGKSSTLNRIAGSTRLARVGKSPGRTQMINLFNSPEGVRLVDLPGYGYARVARTRQEEWFKSINQYLTTRSNLAGVVLTMDIRRPLLVQDLHLIRWAAESSLPVLALLNKSDKLGRGRALAQKAGVEQALSTLVSVEVELFSASKAIGVDRARCWVRERVKGVQELANKLDESPQDTRRGQ